MPAGWDDDNQKAFARICWCENCKWSVGELIAGTAPNLQCPRCVLQLTGERTMSANRFRLDQFEAAFNDAYAVWRATLVEEDWAGTPWADPKGDRLFREVCRFLNAQGRSLGHAKTSHAYPVDTHRY